MRRVPDAVAAGALTWLCLLVTAGPAVAHAELRGSDPVAGDRVEQAPDVFQLDFTEGVTLTRGGMRLLDGDGKPQPLGEPRVSGSRVTVPVPVPGLGQGAYVLVWRVVSADSHPVQGAVPFAVGTADPPPVEWVAGDGGAGVGALVAVIRWMGYAGTALLIGPATLVIGCWPAGRRRLGVRRALLAGGSLTAGAALAGFLAQGPYAAGQSASDLLDSELVAATLGTAYGWAGVARLGAAAGLTAWALRILSGASPGQGDARAGGHLLVGAGLAVIVAATYSAQGHAWAASPRLFAVIVDAVHVLAMSVWLGGLAVLAMIALRPAPLAVVTPTAPGAAEPTPVGPCLEPSPATSVATAVPVASRVPAPPDRGPPTDVTGLSLRRWSRVAMTSVAVLVVTGTLASLREVGGWSALADTNYGRLLIVKMVLFAVLLALASRARAWVRRYTRAAAGAVEGPPVRSLRASVLAEAGVGGLVLAVTAILVALAPASSAGPAAEQGVRGSLPDGTIATVTTDDTRLLSVRVQTRGGDRVLPVEVSAVASLPARDVEGLPVELHPSGQAWAAHADPLPFPGTWRVTVTVRTSDINAGVTTVTLPVR